jgi:8-oxo-dGDP phosphatase
MSDESRPAWFETIDSREVYAGFSTIRVDTVLTPDGEQMEREIVERTDAVAVVALDEQGRIVLLKQYRQPVGGYLLEIPAGLLDVEGEEPEAAARRELAEEIQHEGDEFEHLITFVNSAGWATERTHVYLAEGCRPVAMPDEFVPKSEEADMEVVVMDATDVFAAVHDGVIVDAKTVIGLLLAEPKVASD